MFLYYIKLRYNNLSCLKSISRLKSYYDTLCNPKFALPMQLDISESQYLHNDKCKIPKCDDSTKPKFVLHDGPPYANGEPHVGHALNKVLKDITIRYKLLEGYNVEFRPGWDCHGLPIELKATNSLNSNLTVKETREKARSVALKYVNVQREKFQKWAVLGDWENPYKTVDNDYQANEMIAFSRLYEKGFVIRDKYPVHWSYSTKTALAEAELEYNDQHQSKSVFINFKIENVSSHLKEIIPDKKGPVNLVIWTTTPWTLLANEAVAAHPTIEYCLCQSQHKDQFWICAAEFVSKLGSLVGESLSIIKTFPGANLLGCEYKHPVLKKHCPLLNAEYVTVEKGSGLVHVAPCHGKEDFYLGLEQNLPMNLIVDENACYTKDAGSEFEGLFTLEEGTNKVLSVLNGDILKVEKFIHSYPYDWRSKKPIIIRLSEQWFIDTNKLKHEAARLCEDVTVYPPNMKTALLKFTLNRPRWCISRQRVWGVPIPVFYHKGAPIVHKDFICAISDKVRQEGADFWWEEAIDKLVPQSLCEKLGLDPQHLTRGEDIFDIWFDSGLSWLNVLPESTSADLYLEGEDQFRGWFSSSLLLSTALTGKPPFKNIVSHGFTTDESGNKMSKSLGNVTDPDQVIREYGVDVLRYWAATSGLSSSNIGPGILQQYFTKYKSMRNMFRFMLGNLWDYIPAENSLSMQDLPPIDQYILHEGLAFKAHCRHLYSEFQYEQVLPSFERLSSLISNFYFTAVKDRLYCDTGDVRLCAQTALYRLLCDVIESISPILPVLTEEVLSHWPTHPRTVDQLYWNEEAIPLDRDDSTRLIKEAVEKIALPVRDGVGSAEQIIRNVSGGRKAANPFAAFHMTILPKSVNIESGLRLLQKENSSSFSSLCEILRCSSVTLSTHNLTPSPQTSSGDPIGEVQLPVADVLVSRLDKSCQCSRCRRYVRVESDEQELCSRCHSIVTDQQHVHRKTA